MLNPIGNILRTAKRRQDEPLNILTFPTHERWQNGLANCKAVFWMFRGEGIKDWNFKFGALPTNHILLDPSKNANQIPPEVSFDAILAQSIGQYMVGRQLSQAMHVPLIRMEHTLPPPGMPKESAAESGARSGHVNVTCSQYNKAAWPLPANTRIIHHGLDTEFFQLGTGERKQVVLSVVNDFINRDIFCGYKIWKETVTGLPHMIVGDTPGLSKPAKDVAELRSIYQSVALYLNTTLVSSSPVSPLEAMLCGCPVVSLATTTMPEVIKHGVNGFLGDTPNELRHFCQVLLDDPELCRKMGLVARETVVNKFSAKSFVWLWDNVFRDAANIPFLGEV